MLCDRLPNGFSVLFHVAIGEANDIPPEFAKNHFSRDVLFPNLIVVTIVNFDDRHLRFTGEVRNEATYGMFPPEFQATKLSCAQNTPKQSFRWSTSLATFTSV